MDFDHAFYSFRIWMREKTRFQNANKKEAKLSERQIALLETLPNLTEEQMAELKTLKKVQSKEEQPKPKPKKKRLKPADGRKASKYNGIVGKGRKEVYEE